MSIEQMDIVDFIEQVCSIKLFDFQKEFIRKAYDAAKSHKQIYYIPSRGSTRFFYKYLQLLVILKVAYELGLVKQEEEK